MTFAFSTSSRFVSVAIFESGEVIFSGELDAPRAASQACMELIQRSGISVDLGTRFCADLGPGSFTGVRVGVMLAKTFGFCNQVLVAGSNAFDLVNAHGTVALPSKRGEWFVRLPGEPPVRQGDVPQDATGYGWEPVSEGPRVQFPTARAFVKLVDHLEWVSPEVLMPDYLIEPSISTPNLPLSRMNG